MSEEWFYLYGPKHAEAAPVPPFQSTVFYCIEFNPSGDKFDTKEVLFETLKQSMPPHLRTSPLKEELERAGNPLVLIGE